MNKQKNFIVVLILILIFIPISFLIVIYSIPSTPKNLNFRRGMTYAPFSTDLLEDNDEYENIDNMLSLGVDWVSVVPIWHQEDKTSTEIFSSFEESPSDKGIEKFIKYLHSKNVKVMLKPYVDALDDTWRAEFEPSSWDDWFDSYQDFIYHYAKMADEEDVEMFCVGCEYKSSDENEYDNWKDTIKGIKKRYSGPITYAADWSNYYDVCFWELLDYIGIDAYFPLYEGDNPELSDLIEGWEDALYEIENWREDSDYSDMNVIFTEAGYESQPNCWESPGYTGSDKLNVNDQNLCYKALFSTVPKKSWIEGMFIWWWDNPTTHDVDGGMEDNGWTPKGKPAETTISCYYSINANQLLHFIFIIILICAFIGIVVILIYKKLKKN